MEQYIFKVKKWYIINGVKQFVWSFITYSNKPNKDFAKCNDGGVYEITSLEEL